MMKWMSVVSLMLLGCVIAVAATATPTGTDVPSEADLTGKVLMVSVKEPTNGAFLRQARVHWVGGRAFLVGDALPWSEVSTAMPPVAWLPVDSIQYIAEFSSVEEVKAYYRDRVPFGKHAEPGDAADSR
jgi:hypothetical protein